MGSMDMGKGVPKLIDLQKYFWATIGAMVAFGTAANAINYVLYRQRCVVRFPKHGAESLTGRVTELRLRTEASQTPRSQSLGFLLQMPPPRP